MREMKDSGIEWIGYIPYNWNTGRVKDVFIRKNEKANDENPTVLSLARSGVKIRDISTGEGQLAENYTNYNPVDVDDLLINPMDLYSGANCSVSKVKGVISPAYINLKAKGNNNSTYYDYYFKTQYWSMALFAHGKGVSFDNRWTLGLDTALNYFIPIPPVEEQKKIANCLDEKIEKIDNIIKKTKETIEDYKKYKQIIITKAVTQGINKDIRVKDSGLKWIGDIPENWMISKMKYFSDEIGDGLHSTPEYDDNGDFYFINGNNIGDEFLTIKKETNRLNVTEYRKYKHPILNNFTIMISLNGATYGKISLYNMEKVLLGKSAGYITYKNSMNRKFMKYYLSSYFAKELMTYSLNGTTIQNLSLDTLRNFICFIPSIEEQENIVKYLDGKCVDIDDLILNKEKLIEELEQYKKSLIYEYVTGKKQVI